MLETTLRLNFLKTTQQIHQPKKTSAQ
ncbi:hypothetical protein DSUL_150041 [Desulfovibrionales bacterium]